MHTGAPGIECLHRTFFAIYTEPTTANSIKANHSHEGCGGKAAYSSPAKRQQRNH